MDQTLVSRSTLLAVIFLSAGTNPVLARSWRYMDQPGAVPVSVCEPFGAVVLADVSASLLLSLQEAIVSRITTRTGAIRTERLRYEDTRGMAVSRSRVAAPWGWAAEASFSVTPVIRVGYRAGCGCR